MTPKQYQDIARREKKIIDEARTKIHDAFCLAETCPLPRNLRPTKAKDIIKGAIIWHKIGDNEHFWQIIKEVNINDSFRAYCAEDGCRYDLDNAYIEVI